MLESYKEITSISLNKLKDYLDVIDVYHDSFIDTCRSQKKIEGYIKAHQKKYLGLALKKLYEIDDMQCLENHLVMIEYLFGEHPRIQSLNKNLCNYMLHNITIRCILHCETFDAFLISCTYLFISR